MWSFIALHFFGVAAGILSLGGIGMVAVVLIGGVPLALILAKIIDLVKAAIAFFSTPVGQAIGIVLISIAVFMAGDLHRARQDAIALKAYIARAEQARKDRDVEIKLEVAADANARIHDIDAQKIALESKVSDYEKALAARGANACRATDDDVRDLSRRLR
jgi:hypothetical protein